MKKVFFQSTASLRPERHRFSARFSDRALKRAALLLLLPLLFSLLAFSVSAEEISIEEIDPYTEEPSDLWDSLFPQSKDREKIGEGKYYDYSRRLFAYDVKELSGTPIFASVADGMAVTGTVKIELPTGITAALYRDGTEVEKPNLQRISEPGSYILSVSGASAGTYEPFGFTILNQNTGALDEYRMPEGFMVTEVLLEAMPVSFSPLAVDLTEEGFYKIRYSCTATGLSYSLNLDIDHTPPTLALEAVTDGAAHGPVDISDIEPHAKMSITLDGKAISARDVLKQSGNYHLVVTDEAGNSSVYDFIIMLYFNMTSYLFVILVFVVLAAIIGYLWMSRRKLRVR